MNIKSLSKGINVWGVSEEQETYLQKKIILTNEICLLAGVICIVSAFFIWPLQDWLLFLSVSGLLLIIVFTLLLNKAGNVHFSRFLISFLPLIVLLLSVYYSKQTLAINYIVFSFSILGLNLVPLLIFNFQDEKPRFIAALGFNFICLAFYDQFLVAFAGQASMPAVISDHYYYFKAIQLQLWIFIVLSVMFVKRVNKRFERKLEALNYQLSESNKEMLAQNEEIAATSEELAANNEELTQQQEQIVEQRNFIESQNEELKNYQSKLLNYIYKLSKTNGKLATKQAENKSLLNALRQHFIMIEFDPEANVSWVTGKTCEYLGLEKSKILGRNGNEILKVISDENGRDFSFEEVWDQVLRGEAVNADFELNLPGKDLFISTTLAPIMDENGDPVKILTISEDISSIMSQQKVIASKNDLLEKQQNEIKERNEELRQQKEEIEAINENLEERVKERTHVMEQKNKQLAEYAFINAHLLRAPVSSILGLINLMGHEKLSGKEMELYKYLKESANQLDKIVFKINRAIEMNKELDREFLRE